MQFLAENLGKSLLCKGSVRKNLKGGIGLQSPYKTYHHKTYQNKTYHHKTYQTTKLINQQNLSTYKTYQTHNLIKLLQIFFLKTFFKRSVL